MAKREPIVVNREPVVGTYDPFTTEYPIIDGFVLQRVVPGVFTPWEVETVPIASVGVIALVDVESSAGPSVLLVIIIDSAREPVWEYPAGSVDCIDIDPSATAMREFHEETGLNVILTPPDMFLTHVYTDSNGERKVGIYYLVEIPLPDILSYSTDKLGRWYFDPFPGARTCESDLLALEPWHLFLSSQSLTEQTRYPWFQRKVKRMLNFWYTPR